MTEKKLIKICVMVDGRPFTFRGTFVSKDREYITILDSKTGTRMEFTRSQVTYIEEVDSQ